MESLAALVHRERDFRLKKSFKPKLSKLIENKMNILQAFCQNFAVQRYPQSWRVGLNDQLNVLAYFMGGNLNTSFLILAITISSEFFVRFAIV